jgi:hypothetical protein
VAWRGRGGGSAAIEGPFNCQLNASTRDLVGWCARASYLVKLLELGVAGGGVGHVLQHTARK